MKKEHVYHLDNCEEVQAIAQLSDACIALERDQQDRSEHADTTVRILKNRYSGETGIACKLKVQP